MINYQGKLMLPSGAPIADGTYSMRFAIYDVPTGGTALWSETNPAVQVKGGLFAVMLGSVTNLPANIFDSPDRFFGVTVGTDTEMTPRQKIASVAYAQIAGSVPDGSITVAKLAPEASTPAGTISMFVGSVAPTGWLLCDGAAISRSAYTNLFAITGTAFGSGDGSTTFNIPDYRGVFPKGAGTTNRPLGKDANGNFYSGTLGAYLTDKMQGHYHDISRPFDGYGLTHDGTNGTNGKINLYPSVPAGVYGADPNVCFSARTMKTDGANGTPRIGPTTEPQSLAVSFIIKI